MMGRCKRLLSIFLICLIVMQAFPLELFSHAQGSESAEPAESLEESSAQIGDVNSDGYVDAEDSGILNGYFSGWTGYDARILDWSAADCNQDGHVTRSDAMYLKRHLLGWNGYDISSQEKSASQEPFRIVDIQVDKVCAEVGSTFEWKAHTLGGEGKVAYSFQLYKMNAVSVYSLREDNETVIASQERVDENSFQATIREAGTYVVGVTCTDESGNTCSIREALPITVTSTGLEAISIQMDPEGIVCENTSVVWNVKTVAGNGPFTYEYTLYHNNRKVDFLQTERASYCLPCCSQGEYRLLVSCTDADGFCITEHSDTLIVCKEEEYLIVPPAVRVEGDAIKLGVSAEEAEKSEAGDITLLWDAVSNAAAYGVEVSRYSGGQWLLVHEVRNIFNNHYTVPHSVFQSSGEENLYRLGVYSKGIVEGELRYYYFRMSPAVENTALKVEDGTVCTWDIASARKTDRYFSVFSDLSYTVTSDVDWITCVQSGDGFLATVAENTQHLPSRTGHITVDNGKNSTTIEVNQGNGRGAPVLLYPHLSTDENTPTEHPVGGLTIEFEEKYTSYVGIRIYELFADGKKAVVYEKLVDSEKEFLHIHETNAGGIFAPEKEYMLELSGRYSADYGKNEWEQDLETAVFYIKMTSDGHNILVDGTDYVESSGFEGVSVDLYATNSWTYTTDADWVHVADYEKVKYHKDLETVRIQFDLNNTQACRSALVTFRCGEATAVVKVVQKSWLPRIESPVVSQDEKNPTILPSCGLVLKEVYNHATYAVYENGVWSEEKNWGSTTAEVSTWSTLVPDHHFTADVLHRFTLHTGDYTSVYYAMFDDGFSQNYVVLSEGSDSVDSVNWKTSTAGMEQQVRLKANANWTVSSDAAWLAASATSGGVQTSWKKLTITAQANTTGKERTGTLTFKIGSKGYATLTVTQSGSDYLELFAEDPDDSTDFNRYDPEKTFRLCDGSGDTLYLSAWVNDNWEAVSNSTWITVNKKSAVDGLKSGKEIAIKLEANNGNTIREGTVTISSGQLSRRITITQVPALQAPVLVSPALSTSSRTPSVVNYGDITLNWKAIEGADYYVIRVNPGDPTLLLPNSNFYSDTQKIESSGKTSYTYKVPKKVLSLNADSYDRIEIVAYDAHGYSVTSRYYLMSTLGDAARINGSLTPVWENATDIEVTREFLVRATDNWTARSGADWITLDRTAGADGDVLKVSLSANTGAARSGKVYVTVGNTQTVLTVEQCACLPLFPSFVQPMLSADPARPTLLPVGTTSIPVAWKQEPQAESYQLRLGMFKSNSVETVLQTIKCSNQSEYTLENLELIPGMRYSLTLVRNSHLGVTSAKCYFMLQDENAFVLLDGKSGMEAELDAEYDSAFVTVTSGGVWSAVANDGWLMVDNDPVFQEDLVGNDCTAADFQRYSGISGSRLYISTLPNPSNTYRTGTVTVRSGSAEATVTVIQKPYYELAEIYAPVLAANRQSSMGLPYGNVTVRWNACVGGAGTYQIILEERDDTQPHKYHQIYEKTNITGSSYTIPVKKLKEGGYYCLTLCSDITGLDREESPCKRYYFYIKYKNELGISADVNWEKDAGMVKITASAFGGAGGYLYTYELLCDGKQVGVSMTEKRTYYTFPLKAEGQYQVRVSCHDGAGNLAEMLSSPYDMESLIPDAISLSQTSWTPTANREILSVYVQSGKTWFIESCPTWITCAVDEGESGDSVTLAAASNLSAERTGQVVFISGAARTTLTVVQKSAVLQPEITLPRNGAEIQLGDLTVQWTEVCEAEGYLLTLTDLTMGTELLYQCSVTDVAYTIAVDTWLAGHEYRIDIGAVVDEAVWWSSCVFRIPGVASPSEHDYRTVIVGTALINQSLEAHNVVTTYYEQCVICNERTEQKTATVSSAHTFTYTGYEQTHPHKRFKRCACGAAPYIDDAYQTGNGTVQPASSCCICHGHSFDMANPVEENGQWRAYCTKCGKYKTVSKPINAGTSSHVHLISTYYDPLLIARTYCTVCEPRTPAQLEADAENFFRRAKLEQEQASKEEALRSIRSSTDDVTVLLGQLKERNDTFRNQAGTYVYKFASFQWGDVVRKMVPGSTAVNKVRKQAIQSAMMEICKMDDSQVSKVKGVIDSNIEYIAQRLEQYGKNVIDSCKLVADTSGVVKIVMDKTVIETVPIKETTLIGEISCFDILGMFLETGLDIYEYNQWSDNQQALFFYKIVNDASVMEFLEELKVTYSNDQILRDYCSDMIWDIKCYNWSKLVYKITQCKETIDSYLQIFGENYCDLLIDLSVGGFVESLFEAGGKAVTFAGALGVIVTEAFAGSNSTADCLDYIAILYCDILNTVEAYDAVKNSAAVSKKVKQFQEFNIYFLKMAGLEFARKIDNGWFTTGPLEGLVDRYKERYTGYYRYLQQEV